MRLARYPLGKDGIPLDLMCGVMTDSAGNSGQRVLDGPQGPDGSPIDQVGLVLCGPDGTFRDLSEFRSASWSGLSTTNTAAANVAAINTIMATFGGGARPTLMKVAPGTYNMGQMAISESGVIFDLTGVIFTGPTCEFVTSPTAVNVGIINGALIRTDAVANNNTGPVLHLNGKNNFALGTWLEKAPEGGGYMVMIESVSAVAMKCLLQNVKLRGGNGIFLEGKGHRILDLDAVGRAVGADDCIAFKARGYETSDCEVTGVIEGYGSAVSYGSEIGSLGVTDNTRPGRCQNNKVDIIARNCVFPFFIKPGAIDAGASSDWRTGLVSHNTIRVHAVDLTGAKHQRGVIAASRGAMVRNNEIYLTFEGRCDTTGGVRKGIVDFYIPNYSAATPPAAAPTIKNNFVWVHHNDDWNGVATGAGGAPGQPATQIIAVEKELVSHGVFSGNRAVIEYANGTAVGLVYLGPGCDDAITLERCGQADNINVSGGAANGGGVWAESRMTVGPDITMNVVQGYPYRVGAAGEVLCNELGGEFYLFAQVNAGNSDTQYPWAARRRCQLAELSLNSTVAVAASDVNYTNLQFRNIAGSGDIFLTPKTKSTGATSTARNFTIAAGVYSVVYQLKDLVPGTDTASLGDTLFPKDGQLYIFKTDTGAGAIIASARLRIRALPY